MKLASKLLIGLSLVLGLVAAMPDSAEARPHWGRHRGHWHGNDYRRGHRHHHHHRHGYYGYYSPHRSWYSRPRYYSYGTYGYTPGYYNTRPYTYGYYNSWAY